MYLIDIDNDVLYEIYSHSIIISIYYIIFLILNSLIAK